MKQNLIIFLCLLTIGLQAQTIFVKQNASGSNDGSSWANAYPSLDQALSVAASSTNTSIWVAAGTYKPSTPAPNHSFLLSAGNNLYGGFAGTETSLNQRNISANPTILNGDIAGDDTPGNFTANRTDNSPHVLVVFVQTTNNGSIVDGFTIKGGQTMVGTPNLDLTRRGGGLLLNAKAQVLNCTFTDNYGESGAALAALDAISDQVSIENCTFNANKATQEAICFLRGTPTGLIKNCTFSNNNTRRGSLYPHNSVDVKIDGCLFERNLSKGTVAAPNFGAGMFTWQSTFSLTNSIFRHNNADNAAGIYIDGRDGGDIATINNCLFENDTTSNVGAGIYANQATMTIKNTIVRNNLSFNGAGIYCDGREFDSSFSIDSCTFEGNRTTSYGGTGLYQYRTNYTMSNCSFKDNIAPSSGAAIYHSDQTKFNISNCLFDGNKANFAGAVTNFGIGCVGTYDACTFSNNQAVAGGGVSNNGFKANVTYKNCNFLANKANYGGAIFTQNDTTRIIIDGCHFEGNEAAGASGTAGCVYINTNIAATVKNSTFLGNMAITGGAINANGDSMLIIDKCAFLENIATTQGAALNFNQVNCNITNSLFAKNINTGVGAGGAISNNASDNEVSKVKAVNCTFAENFAVLGAGIAQWEGPLGTAQLTLLNCLFQNMDGLNYEIEEGMPEVFSLGGNQSSDQTLSTYLAGNKDLHGTFNAFQNADGNDYAHTIGSPASDGGVSAGAPGDDIIGVPRWGIPDVGYREVKVSGTNNPRIQVLSLQCAPNPSVDQTVLSLKSERNGSVQIAVWNKIGQLVASYSAEKTAEAFSFPLDISRLAAGAYKVQVRMGAVVHEGAFAKF